MSRSCVVVVALAATVFLPGPARAQPTDDAVLREAMTQMADAWNRDDLDGHAAPYADDATFMTPEGPRRGRVAIVEGLARSFRRGEDLAGDLSFSEVEVRMLGPDAALMLGRFTLTGLSEGRTSEGRFTLVWARGPDGWRIVHDHSS
jgi:beta-aspartyl-peptidase (threonine type)